MAHVGAADGAPAIERRWPAFRRPLETSLVLFAFVVLAPDTLRAQVLKPEGGPQPEPVSVELRAIERMGLEMEVYDPGARPGRELPSRVCVDRCELEALPGKYLLRVSGPSGSDVKTSQRYLELRSDALVVVDPPSAFGRYLGLSLGIAGPVLLASGIMLSFSGGLDGSGDVARGRVALALVAGGLVVTPTGWVLFGINGRPRVEIVPRSR